MLAHPSQDSLTRLSSYGLFHHTSLPRPLIHICINFANDRGFAVIFAFQIAWSTAVSWLNVIIDSAKMVKLNFVNLNVLKNLPVPSTLLSPNSAVSLTPGWISRVSGVNSESVVSLTPMSHDSSVPLTPLSHSWHRWLEFSNLKCSHKVIIKPNLTRGELYCQKF
jgi:hypothetical protein